MLSTLSLWLVTSRPLLYPLVPIIILFGYFHAGGTILTLSPEALLVLFVFSAPFSLIVYGLNDIYDADSDAINQKRHWLTGAVAAPTTHRSILIGVALSIVLFLAVMIMVGNQLLGLMMSLALLFAYFYSVPPLRLKAVPMVDCLVSGVGYVLIPFLIGTALRNTVFIEPEVLIIVLFVAAYHILCSVRDYEADKSVGDRTTVVWLGVRTSLVLVSIISLLCASVWYTLRPFDWLGVVFLGSLGVVSLLVLYRPNCIRLVVNGMVPLAALVALYKLFF